VPSTKTRRDWSAWRRELLAAAAEAGAVPRRAQRRALAPAKAVSSASVPDPAAVRRVRQARRIRQVLERSKAPFPPIPQFRSDIRFESTYSLQRQHAVCARFLDGVRRFLEAGGTLSARQRADARQVKMYMVEVARRLPIGCPVRVCPP
jgi:hypothetical protein